MTFQDITAGFVALVVLTALVGFLWTYVRWGILPSWRLRGWQERLARPLLEEVESRWSVHLPRALETLYRSGGLAEQFEFCLAPPGQDSSRRWYISAFIPLTVRDVAEWIQGTAVPGIPLACDEDKGIYYLPFEALRRGGRCPVVLRRPGSRSPTETEVAASVEDFVRFQPVPAAEDEEEEA